MAISVPEQGRLRHPISYFRTELYATPAYRSDTPWCIRAVKLLVPVHRIVNVKRCSQTDGFSAAAQNATHPLRRIRRELLEVALKGRDCFFIGIYSLGCNFRTAPVLPSIVGFVEGAVGVKPNVTSDITRRPFWVSLR